MSRLTYKQATASDIPVIEDILFDVTDYFEKIGDPQWRKYDVTWPGLAVYFRIEDFRIAYLGDIPIGCMVILDKDDYFWPEIPKGGSLYIHKLAVRRAYAGQGFALEMIDYVKSLSVERGINQVRLDCRAYKHKLRRLYEEAGFTLVKEAVLGDYSAAFYLWTLQEKTAL
ncbi:MAG: GNAT family N-acetyltransferase [Clostridia bacterium]|nr:GNAT family N-acetyltransferase [Clostridia bacterium]